MTPEKFAPEKKNLGRATSIYQAIFVAENVIFRNDQMKDQQYFAIPMFLVITVMQLDTLPNVAPSIFTEKCNFSVTLEKNGML